MEDEKLEKWHITQKHDIAIYKLLEEYQSIIQQTFEIEDSDEYWQTLMNVFAKFIDRYKKNYYVKKLALAYLDYQTHRAIRHTETE